MADWQAGTYVLTVDKFDKPIYEGEGAIRQQVDVVQYVKGDEIDLDERDARRLGNSDSIAPENSASARAAKGEIDPRMLDATSGLSLESKKAQLEVLKAKIEEEEAVVSEMEDEGMETRALPVQGHPGTSVPGGDPENQEDAAKSSAVRRRGNRSNTKRSNNSEGSEG